MLLIIRLRQTHLKSREAPPKAQPLFAESPFETFHEFVLRKLSPTKQTVMKPFLSVVYACNAGASTCLPTNLFSHPAFILKPKTTVMKKKPLHSSTPRLASLCLLFWLYACNDGSGSADHSTSSSSPTLSVAEETAKETSLFNGRYTGAANEQTFRLNLSNDNGTVKGTMSEKGKSYTLSGTVSGETLAGNIDVGAKVPFKAHHYGNNLVVQLDEDTINGLKAAGVIGSLLLGDDGAAATQILLVQSKIIFMPE